MEITEFEKDETAEIFGKNLRLYLKTRGITQKELADRLGTGTNVVNAWIQGKRCPSLHWLCNIRDILNVSFENLLLGPDTEEEYRNVVRERYETFYNRLFPYETELILPDNYEQLSNVVLSLTLKPREKELIVRRFGLEGEMPASCSKLSKEFGVSRQRISQIIARSCNTLRNCKQYLLPERINTETSYDTFMRFLTDLRNKCPYRVDGNYDTYNDYAMAWNDCITQIEEWAEDHYKGHDQHRKRAIS